MKRVEEDVAGKGEQRIYKQEWKPRSEVEFELGAKNVIYMLFDSKAKHFYVGEAADLVKRLAQTHPSIPNWDHFRYNVLPPALGPFRVALERMLIRDFTAVLTNKGGVEWRDISGCLSLMTELTGERQTSNLVGQFATTPRSPVNVSAKPGSLWKIRHTKDLGGRGRNINGADSGVDLPRNTWVG